MGFFGGGYSLEKFNTTNEKLDKKLEEKNVMEARLNDPEEDKYKKEWVKEWIPYLDEDIEKLSKKIYNLLGSAEKEAGKMNEKYEKMKTSIGKPVTDLFEFRVNELGMSKESAREMSIKELEGMVEVLKEERAGVPENQEQVY